MHVLAVGAGSPELERASEAAEDLLGALASLADGGIDAVVVLGDLPDAPAADAVRAIRERSPQVPVIVVGDPAEDELQEAGAIDVVDADAGSELVDRAVRYAVTVGRLRARILDLEARLAELEPDDGGGVSGSG
jgi:DNA-binding NarL/FixJ family response regulator